MNIKLCQMRPQLGDIHGNLEIIKAQFESATEDIIVFSELFLSGYPPYDCLWYPNFVIELQTAIEHCVSFTKGSQKLLIFGSPIHKNGQWYNSVLAVSDGKIIHQYDKQCLPNYDIFNESRYFIVGSNTPLFKWQKYCIALFICEDIWVNHVPVKYESDPIEACSGSAIDVAIHISASPFEYDKIANRFSILRSAASRLNAPIVSVNQVGGYNEILFDGQSMVLDKFGSIMHLGAQFESEVVSLPLFNSFRAQLLPEPGIETIQSAIIFGLQEYCKHSGFSKVLIGVSGGIDSAVVAALAVEALGKDAVTCVSMPTQYNSMDTQSDASRLVENLACNWIEYPIETTRKAIAEQLTVAMGHSLSDLTEQNIQARLRGIILMSLSNQTGALLLTTGNKSELAMGYATLYGDMCGGLNIIGDVFKQDVFKLARHINLTKEIIPETIISRPPSAELAPNQKDSDSLPEYDDLDPILTDYILNKKSLNELGKMNDNIDIMSVISTIHKNEFKRFQSPPILKVSSRAFGRGWQYPIVH